MGSLVTLDEKYFWRGTISETWKQIEPDGWFNPAFQNFISTEIIGASRIRT